MQNLQPITEFRGDYSFLSNFYSCSINLWGIRFNSAEHAFVWCKSEDEGYRARILACLTPGEAKRAGRQAVLREDWDTLKVDFMYAVVRAKFSQNSTLRGYLLKTAGRELIEGNYWHDSVWGCCVCSKCPDGENLLGKILMTVRGEIS